MQAADAPLVRRARPLLGTLVTIHVVPHGDAIDTMAAVDAAFDEIACIHRCMSAHEAGSDVARLARARAGDLVAVDPRTLSVLRLARHWQGASSRAFDPEMAARVLARQGQRRAVAPAADGLGSLAGSDLEGPSVRVDGPLALDLGGIAKGYAVDRAVDVLRRHGVREGLVNAGGDLRAFGQRPWRIDLQHPVVWSRSRRLLRLREGAVASSVRGVAGSEFVGTRRRAAPWRGSTVIARDCVTADVLTKWVLQAPEHSVQLRAALARSGARAWRA